jgi:glyoxylate reductase
MSRAVVVTSFELPQAARDLLEERSDLRGPADWEAQLAEAEVLVTNLSVRVDERLLSRAPRLRLVANAVAGYDHVDLAACRARRVVATNTPGVLTDATADLTWALLLATLRRLPQAERSLRAGEFAGWGFGDYLGAELGGRTLGIFGMGRIGQAVARRAAAFGMPVIYHSRRQLPPETERSLGVRAVGWESLLQESDVISLHAPLTPGTFHRFGRDAFERMRPGSYLINTARGPLVDEAALVEALESGRLAGAGLDVYEHEPEVHPGLVELDSVVLLPHIGSATVETRARMAVVAARNVVAVLAGQAAPDRIG